MKKTEKSKVIRMHQWFIYAWSMHPQQNLHTNNAIVLVVNRLNIDERVFIIQINNKKWTQLQHNFHGNTFCF